VQTPSLDGEGMEYPGIVFVEMTPGSAYGRSWAHTAALLAHELAHQWFYGIVGNNQWREPWLDESFATFASGFPAHSCTSGDPRGGAVRVRRRRLAAGLADRRALTHHGDCPLHRRRVIRAQVVVDARLREGGLVGAALVERGRAEPRGATGHDHVVEGCIEV